MTRSHASQRDDFQDSVPEIDFLVDTALGQAGCHGARLTGGGFGGCTVNLVETKEVTAFTEAIVAAFDAKYGAKPEIYVCTASDGALARLASEAGSIGAAK